MCAKHTSRPDSEPNLIPDPDALPTTEYLLTEADLNHEVDQFEKYVDGLMEQEITDRDTAERVLDIIDGWMIRIEKVEEKPALSRLSDVELFDRTGGDKEADVVPVAVVRHWLGQGDNLERLTAFRDALDDERFELKYRAQQTN